MPGLVLMEVLILGMHRSGTSLVSAIINKLGISGGDEGGLERSAEWNPKGYWEFRQFTQANNRILAVLGARWDRVAGLRDSLFGQHEGELSRICMELEPSFARFGERGDWAVKDPRMCLALPAWRARLGNPLAVLVVRDPIEVAISLNTRDQMPLVVGIALWEFYMKSAFRHSKGMPRILVDYNALLLNPEREISRLREKLVLHGVAVTAAAEDIHGFVDNSLYRSRNQNREAAGLLNLKQREFYEALRHEDMGVADTVISAGGLEVLGLYEKAFPEEPVWKRKWRHLLQHFDRGGR